MRPEVPEHLRGLVAGMQGYRIPALPGGVHRGLPSRHLTFVVNLPVPMVVDGIGARLGAHGVVGGLHTTPARIDASVPQEGVMLALTPVGAQALLGVPARELAGAVADLADVAGRRGAELVERLATASSWAARFNELVRWLTPVDVPPPPPEVRRAWRQLVRSRGALRVGELAADVGWSRRHLGERFVQATGLTPKQAARVIRFEHAHRALRCPDVALAEVAAACGYTDQPHLCREWREMAGCTPAQWRREELPFVQDGEDRSRAA